MKNTLSTSRLCLLVFMILPSALPLGCGQKQSTSPASTPAANESPQVTATAPAAQPVTQVTQDLPTEDARIAEAQAAMKSKDYGRAAAALALPRQTPLPMTGQQLMSINSEKANMVNQLSAAAAAGDPKAKATLEMLRQRALNHQY